MLAEAWYKAAPNVRILYTKVEVNDYFYQQS
jgi:hypothetical protein